MSGGQGRGRRSSIRGYVLAVALVLVPAAAAAAQVRGGSSPEVPSSPAGAAARQSPVSAAQRTRAEQMLRRHAERSRRVHVLAADYQQRRTTSLSVRPLLSSGTFVFVKAPPCVVFRAREPRVSIVRLLPERYEVFRPDRQRLERFLLPGQELAQGLFSALGGDADRLQRDFEIVGCRDVTLRTGPAPADGGPGEEVGGGRTGDPEPAAPGSSSSGVAAELACVEIRLAPRSEEVRERLQELVITLVTADAQIRIVAYRDQSGDLVEIELTNLRIDPEQPPSVDFVIPDGTRIIEHEAQERSGR